MIRIAQIEIRVPLAAYAWSRRVRPNGTDLAPVGHELEFPVIIHEQRTRVNWIDHETSGGSVMPLGLRFEPIQTLVAEDLEGRLIAVKLNDLMLGGFKDRLAFPHGKSASNDRVIAWLGSERRRSEGEETYQKPSRRLLAHLSSIVLRLAITSNSGYLYPYIHMLSQTVEYSLRAIVWLASHADEPQTTQQISEATMVPAGYLAKVMQSLGRGGLVAAQRGKRGGFLLTRPAAELSVLEVVNLVDPVKRIRHCPLGIAGHGSYLCPLHKRLDAAMAMVEHAFQESSIADLLAEPSTSKPLCRIAEA